MKNKFGEHSFTSGEFGGTLRDDILKFQLDHKTAATLSVRTEDSIAYLTLYSQLGDVVSECSFRYEPERGELTDVILIPDVDEHGEKQTPRLHFVFEKGELDCDLTELYDKINDIDTRLAQEILDRIAAVTAEAEARTEADDELHAEITAETDRATEAEGVLQDSIDAEERARIAGDKAVNDRIDGLYLAQQGADGSYIKYASQTDGLVSATAQAFDLTLEGATDANAPTSKTVKDYVDTLVEETVESLDVAEVGEDGKFVQKIEEVDGKISTTLKEFAAELDADDTTTALTNKATTDAINAEKDARIACDNALNTRIDNLDLAEVGADGSYVKLVSQADGQVSATAAAFDTTIPLASPSNITAPTSKAVRNAINDLDVGNITENLGRGKTLTALSETDGKISATAEDIQIISSQITDKQDTYDGTDSKVVTGKALKAAIETLDIDQISNTAGKTVVTITEADGKVGATFQDIQITESQVTNLETDLATLDNKLNYNVHLEENTDEITYDGDTVTKTSPYRNLKTGATGSRSENIHLANTTTAGLMSHNDYNTIIDLSDRVASLEGTSVRITYSDSDIPTADQIKAAATAYLASRGVIDPTDSDYNGVSVRVTGTNHLWNYYANLQAYRDDGLDTVSTFTNSIAGIIKGAGETDGSIYAESDGTGSVYGWNTLKTRVTNAENTLSSSLNAVSYDSTNKKLTKTTNAGATTDIISLNTMKTDMSLNNVDNTSDINKPISTATQAALDLKEDKTNKTTSISSASTDEQYPSAKAVYDFTKDSANLVETTWAALKDLRDSGQLIPGRFYRITDYTCTTATENTGSAGHVFDIIVRADSTDKLNEEAGAILHSGDTYFANSKLEAWKLWYCLDNDINRFE